jgi:hypothetical protein
MAEVEVANNQSPVPVDSQLPQQQSLPANNSQVGSQGVAGIPDHLSGYPQQEAREPMGFCAWLRSHCSRIPSPCQIFDYVFGEEDDGVQVDRQSQSSDQGSPRVDDSLVDDSHIDGL